MKSFLKSILLVATLSAPLLAQNIQVTTLNYGGGNIVSESSGNGVPTDACSGLAEYIQKDAAAGTSNEWLCISGHMVHQPTGATGATGAAGTAATVAVGTVTTGAAGTSVAITNSGTSNAAILNFTIPRGDTGANGTGNGSGTDPSAAGVQFWNATTQQWELATYTELQTVLSSDTVHNSALAFSTGSSGDSSIPTPTSGKDFLAMKGGQLNYSHSGAAYTPFPSAPTASSINALIETLSGCNVANNLYSPQLGTCVAPPTGGSGGGNIMVVPRDINPHLFIVNAGASKFDGYAASMTNSIGSGAVTYSAPSTLDAAGYSYASIDSGTTANTAQGWVGSKDQLATNPSFKFIAGVSSAASNVWIGLTNAPSSLTSTLDPGGSLGNSFIGFRHFVGTEPTNWTCYTSEYGTYASNTADTGVAVDTTKQQMFDVVFTGQVPKFYINGTQVCSGMTLTDVPDVTVQQTGYFGWQNTTTTSVTGHLHVAYYGAN